MYIISTLCSALPIHRYQSIDKLRNWKNVWHNSTCRTTVVGNQHMLHPSIAKLYYMWRLLSTLWQCVSLCTALDILYGKISYLIKCPAHSLEA